MAGRLRLVAALVALYVLAPYALSATQPPARRPKFVGANTSSTQMSGLIAWFPLQEARGLSFQDVISGRVLKYSGASGSGWDVPLIDPVLGQTLNFDGSSSQADVAGNTSTSDAFYSLAGSFSISVWVVPNRTGEDDIMNHRSAAGGEAGDYYIGIDTNGKMYGGIFSGAFRSVGGTTVLSNGTLYHLVVSFDDPGDVMNLYINGRLEATGAITQALAAGNVPFHLGYSHIAVNPQNRFAGGMADFRLYNKALTSQEAWALYDPNTRWQLYQLPKPYTFFLGQMPINGFSPFEVVP